MCNYRWLICPLILDAQSGKKIEKIVRTPEYNQTDDGGDNHRR